MFAKFSSRKALVATIACGIIGTGGAIGIGTTLASANTTPAPTAAAGPVSHVGKGHLQSLTPLAFRIRQDSRILLARQTAQQAGLTVAKVRADFKAGQSLAQIAGTKTAAVEADVYKLIETRLDAQVKLHHLTAAREATILAHLKTLINNQMNAHHKAKP